MLELYHAAGQWKDIAFSCRCHIDDSHDYEKTIWRLTVLIGVGYGKRYNKDHLSGVGCDL